MQRSQAATEPGFRLEPHPGHPRLKYIPLAPDGVRAFFESVADVEVQELEYVPFMRFVLARRLDEALGGTFGSALRAIIRHRATGGFTTGIADVTRDPDDLVKFATAVAHLVGPANFDAMSQTYYARFSVEHTDASDSYLRQAYRNLTLHTDGTFVDDATDWLLMMKMVERHAVGGESRALHLDDWDELERFTSDPLAAQPLVYKSPPSKNVQQVVKRTTFFRKDGKWNLCFIDQFAYPATRDEADYLYELSRSLERSAATIALPVGDLLMLNNGFWAHGRAAFAPNERLYRELMRIRGVFS